MHRPRRLLAARRTEPPNLAGRWELPGGKVEPGEDVLVALHREIAEELGVEIELGSEVLAPSSSDGVVAVGWSLGDRHVMRVWTAQVLTGEPAPIEQHDAVLWLEPGRWLDLDWLEGDVPVVRALLATFAPPV